VAVVYVGTGTVESVTVANLQNRQWYISHVHCLVRSSWVVTVRFGGGASESDWQVTSLIMQCKYCFITQAWHAAGVQV
jgi:hypothetical protein